MNILQNTTLSEAVISLAVVLLMAVILPALRARLMSQVRNEQAIWLYRFIEEVVKAAEQTFRPGSATTPEAVNALKKSYVRKETVAYARQHGITISEEQLDAFIEAAVYQLKQWGQSTITVSE